MQIVGKDTVGIGVGAYIQNKSGQVLLMYRPDSIVSHRTTSGMWSIPGGELDFGETAENAVAREVMEELGVRVVVEKFIGYSDQVLSDAHWVSLHFLCRIESGEPSILEKDKCEKIEWHDPKNLPENSGTTHVLRPTLLMGYISQKEFNKRKIKTKES